MPIQINTSIKGKEYAPYVVHVERGQDQGVRPRHRRPLPFYLDDEVGRASPWGDIIAPPTFAITFKDEKADTASLLKDLGTDISRILHGEQEFEHFKPIRPGDTLLCRGRISTSTRSPASPVPWPSSSARPPSPTPTTTWWPRCAASPSFASEDAMKYAKVYFEDVEVGVRCLRWSRAPSSRSSSRAMRAPRATSIPFTRMPPSPGPPAWATSSVTACSPWASWPSR